MIEVNFMVNIQVELVIVIRQVVERVTPGPVIDPRTVRSSPMWYLVFEGKKDLT